MIGSNYRAECKRSGLAAFAILTMLAVIPVVTVAQQPSPEERRRVEAEEAARQQKRAENSAKMENAMRDAFNDSAASANNAMSKSWSIQRYKKVNLRDATEAEKAAIAVDSDLLRDYQKLSISGISGINRLLSQVQCGHETADESLKSRCLKYSMPGNGSSFSFRSNGYRATRYADLTLTQDGFVAGGVRSISFLADLGDREISSLTLESKGVKPGSQYAAPREYQFVKQDWEAFDGGKRIDGIDFSRRAKPVVGNTYVLRSIAYRGTSYQKSYETTFNELDLDERTDVVIVFKVVKQDNEGYTIIWRQLSSSKAPSYEYPSK